MFKVAEDHIGRFFNVPQMLDFNALNRSVYGNLNPRRTNKTGNCKTQTEFQAIITVSESPYDDVIIGNGFLNPMIIILLWITGS